MITVMFAIVITEFVMICAAMIGQITMRNQIIEAIRDTKRTAKRDCVAPDYFLLEAPPRQVAPQGRGGSDDS